MISAPFATAILVAAIVPVRRSDGFGSSRHAPMKALRDTPTSNGRPKSLNCLSSRKIAKSIDGGFPNPIPGSRMIFSVATPCSLDIDRLFFRALI